MSEEETQDLTPSQVREIENGLFNMTITLVQTLTSLVGGEKARAYVIAYLKRLINGLEMADNDQGEATDD